MSQPEPPQEENVELVTSDTIPLAGPASTTLDSKEEEKEDKYGFVGSLKLTQSLTILTDDNDTIISTALDKIACCLSFLLDERSPLNEENDNFEQRCVRVCVTTKSRVREGQKKKKDLNETFAKHEDNIKSLYNTKYDKFWNDMYQHFNLSATNTFKSSVFEISKIIRVETEKVGKVKEATEDLRKGGSGSPRSLAMTPRFETTEEIKKRRHRDPLQLVKINSVAAMREWLQSLKPAETTDVYKEMDDALSLFTAKENIKKMKSYNIEDVKSLKMSILMGNRPMTQWKWFHVVRWIEKIPKLNQFASVFWEWRLSGAELCLMDEHRMRLLIQCCHGYSREHDKLDDLIDDLKITIEKHLLLSVVTFEYESIYELIALLASKKKQSENVQKAQKIYELLQFLRAKHVDGPKVLWKLDVFYFNKIDNILSVLLISSKTRRMFLQYFPTYLRDAESRKRAESTDEDNVESKHNEHKEEEDEDDFKQATLDKLLTKRGMVDVSMDTLGDTVDKVCCNKCKCGTFIKEFDRMYLRIICLLLFALSVGCLITWFWMRRRARMEISVAMAWSAEAIADRAIQAMEYEFFVPQMLLNIAIGGIINGDITIENSNDYVDNAQYDAFFVQYKEYSMSKDSVHALYMYSPLNDTMIGYNGSMIYIFNGSCGFDYVYDNELMQRDVNDVSFEGCDYTPKDRPWYTKAMTLNFDDMGWTEPYVFTDNNAIGMSLVRRMEYNGIEVIFITEFTTEGLNNIFSSFENVIGGITYLIASDGSVLASDIAQIDCVEDIKDCMASNALLVNSVDYIRNDDDIQLDIYNNATEIITNDFTITLYSFKSVYLDSLNVEYGTIAVVYDDEHLVEIKSAELGALILYIISTVFAVLSICCVDRCKIQGLSDEEIIRKQIKNNEEDTDPSVNGDERKFRTYFFQHIINVYKCSFWYTFIVFLLTYSIWEMKVDPLWHDTMDIFLNEEYLVVQDKVMTIIDIGETISDIIEERYNRDDMPSFEGHVGIQTDVYLANIMEAFKDANGDYAAYMVYIASPDGTMIGVRQETDNDTDHSLRVVLRDNSTEWRYVQYAVNPITLERENTDDTLFETNLYDPRCREWYQLAVSYMFNGNLFDAFGGYDTFLDFYDSTTDVRLSGECIDAIQYYQTIWDVSSDDIESIDNTSIVLGLDTNNIYDDNSTSYSLIWSQYLFSSTATTGLTATKPIIDGVSGELLAIVSIDFTLDALTEFLNHTDGSLTQTSWIMRADSYEMLASSTKEVTQQIDNDLSCVTISGTCYEISNLLPYTATEHPDYFIRVVSQEIDLFYDPSDVDTEEALPINTPTSPAYLDLPLDLPNALSGRLVSYPYHNNSVELDWIIVKLMDIDVIKTAEEDDTKVMGFLLLVTLYAVYRIQSQLEEVAEVTDGATDDGDDVTTDDHDNVLHIDDASQYEWLMNKMENFVEYSSYKNWYEFNNKFKLEIGNHPIRTSMATDFMAKQSNQHIESKKDGDLTMLLYALQYEHRTEGIPGKILRFINAYSYNAFMNIIICLHLIFSMYLPVNPQVLLSDEGFTNSETRTAIITISVLIIIEIIDVLLHGVGRYLQFGVLSLQYSRQFAQLRYGRHHPYISEIEKHSPVWLTFFGTGHWQRFIVHIILVIAIVCDTVAMMTVYVGVFTYYIPIVPILLVVRSQTIREFSIQFFYAVFYAKEILISYFILILIVSILASSIFSTILNPDESVDTFASSIRALISSFVFVSTGENYNEIVYSAIDQSEDSTQSGFWFHEIHNTVAVFNLLFFVIVSIVGLYFFIPVMIFKFESAFDHSRKVNDNVVSQNKLRTKINLTIAAFIWLDMTDDGTISRQEFDLLVHSSVISRNILMDAFEYDDDLTRSDDNVEISLYEFVSTMINGFHSFAVGIDSRKCSNSRFQAILECNIFRRTRNRHYVLVYCIIPSILVALLRGLGDIDVTVLNTIVHIFFALNFIDINLRWYAFGLRRYFSLIKYTNPPRVQQSIYNWKLRKNNLIGIDKQNILELIHSEKDWVSYNLLPTKPQTLWQKRTLSEIHKAELYLIWFSFVGFIATFIAPSALNGYYYFFVQLYLFRLFTLVQGNQRLLALIFTILPHTLNILAFLFIFIFFYARIGCTLFGNKTDFVLDDVYSTVSNANFNTLGSSILSLMQLMIGEGWHEIMYLHMIATRVEHAAYFIIYIVIVTLIISNIFIGLFLSEIEDLDHQQSQDDFTKQMITSNKIDAKAIARKRRNKLMNQLNQLRQAEKSTQKQIQKINRILSIK